MGAPAGGTSSGDILVQRTEQRQPKAPEIILEKRDGKGRPSVCRRHQPPTGLPVDVARSGGGRGVAEKVLDVLLPPRPAVTSDEVLRSPNPTSLEDACSVRFLQGNGEACVPGPKEQSRSPRPHECKLR